MGKPVDVELGGAAGLEIAGGGGGGGVWSFTNAIGRAVSFRCVFVLALAVGVLIPALLLLVPTRGHGFLSDDPDVLSAEIQVGFTLEKPVSFLAAHMDKLGGDIFEEIGIPNSKVSIVSMRSLTSKYSTYVVFSVLPSPKDASISLPALSVLRSSLIEMMLNQVNLSLTPSLFGHPSSVELLRFPGGITVIPEQSGSVWADPLFNFVLNNSIYQILGNITELKDQLKLGLNLRSYEKVYLQFRNEIGSSVDAPATIEASLTRTPSSLLRSPTVRNCASFQAVVDAVSYTHLDVYKRQHLHPHLLLRAAAGPAHPLLLLALPLAVLLVLLLLLLRDDHHLVLLAAAAAAALAAAAGAARLLRGRLRLRRSPGSGSVQWFIGDEDDKPQKRDKGKGGAPHGRVVREGVEFYSNGDCYEGEFHKGRCNGSGVYNFFGKGKYEGDWVDGKYDGYGIESWARGSRYRGQYRQGLRHGHGVYRFYSGDCYAGEWAGGQSHGIGAQTCSDGSSYVGEFKCGVKHGLGSYHFRNGDRYAGEYFGDKIHGFGVYSFANGHCYEGSWHEGKKQGFGMYTFRNGDKRSGDWDSGTLKSPLSPTDPSVQRAVQAAQRAAENAFCLPRVDEQVHKTVMAANRAATAARVAAIKAVQNRMDGKFCDTYV
ncbi:hypothetical protein E2562_009329 [Oryza meyeriana var. granulata]|uniref:DUF7036 domain-containing protein n=1 Tax=Oryza meyeriana var. granulata TaxID=110450 RepID=A0A6G1CF04_9ORYZ|nr:hypothetical protein E2562_009329 [Oryza meyeriana var. granulata]KAF0898720.1 hypothetical protein E2562_009329 [Oryza meyeriana var. granulata]